jgi:hypothetical protein
MPRDARSQSTGTERAADVDKIARWKFEYTQVTDAQLPCLKKTQEQGIRPRFAW